MTTFETNQEADNYWLKALSDCDCTPFPALPPLVLKPVIDRILDYRFSQPSQQCLDITPSALLYASWALLVGRLTNSDDVVFGATMSGQVDGLHGSETDIVPLRLKLRNEQLASGYIRSVQQQLTEMRPFGNTGLERIANASAGVRQACSFQTLIIIETRHGSRLGLDTTTDDPDQSWLNTYALVLKLDARTDGITATASFDSKIINAWTVQKLLERFEHIMLQLARSLDNQPILSEVSTLTSKDLEDIWQWNRSVPSSIERCVHEIFEDLALIQPTAPAISAWDGELSYGELNTLSSKLAGRLVELGVRHGDLVPLCFEKSLWAAVAVLGVLKAGGGFVLLDTLLPEQRLQTIVKQVNAAIILCSLSKKDLGLRIGPQVIPIHSHFFEELGMISQCTPMVKPTPASLAYVVFTSGSTGTPKGVTICHKHLASAVTHQVGPLGITKDSRVFDFASYSFDPCISNIFRALTVGACLCVPSENDRRTRLAESISALGATFAELTPSGAQFLNPTKLPHLRTIMFGGEAVRVQDSEPYWGKIRFLNAYGPAECTPTATISSHPDNLSSCDESNIEESTRIGQGLGQVTWVVDPDNHNLLVPPGFIGELLLEGPMVGPGYLNDPEKTDKVFISDPDWLGKGSSGCPGRRGRLYKTGDLVRYNSDGTLTFVGRKDAQVKIRGQRVELGEVEHRVYEGVPGALQVVVEVIKPQGGHSNPILAAFIQMKKENSQDASPSAPSFAAEAEPNRNTPKVLSVSANIEDKLSECLPSYMVPTAFFALQDLPMTATGKTDRKRLREIGSSFSMQRLAELKNTGPKRQPVSKAERQMQTIWASVLNITQDIIGLDDSFFRLGGDSIAAVKVVGEARKSGVELTVADIFSAPKLWQVAKNGTDMSSTNFASQAEIVLPFSLLADGVDVASLCQEVAAEYNLNLGAIEDIYPCTPLQEGLLSLSSKRPGDYVMRGIMELADDLSIGKFRDAWEEVAQVTAILRTRIIQHKKFGLLQVVLDEQIHWNNEEGLEYYLQSDKEQTGQIGQPLVSYAIIKDESNKYKWFVWTMHHSLYDGWSLPIILEEVSRVYSTGESPKNQPQFRNFIKHILGQDKKDMEDYWNKTLENWDNILFPALPPSIQEPMADRVAELHIRRPPGERCLDVTPAILIRAAWGLVASRLTGSEDVIFGVTTSGRSASVIGIDRIAAPTIATIPVRVTPTKGQKVLDYLETVQRQATEMIEYEQAGLHRIAKMCPEGQQAVNFQTLLVIQPQENNAPQQDILGKWQDGSHQEQVNTYALLLELHLGAEDNILARAKFDPRVISPWMANKLLRQLEFVMRQLDSAGPYQTLEAIDIITEDDLVEIWKWNATVPESVDRCVHEIIFELALQYPSAPAVCAWDGDLSYAELDLLSTQFAGLLLEIGVESLVPICSEKSKWTVVAMLSVLKAGAGFVLLDSSLPEHRLLTIMQISKASLVVSSVTNRSLSSRLAKRVVTMDSRFFEGLGDLTNPQLPSPSSSSIMYAVFTSGSTGTPKGVAITHGNLATALHHQLGLCGLTRESRLYDFASYSFDVSISNAFQALTAGGCLCIPSEVDRKDRLLHSILALRANVLHLTPSVAQFISPDDIRYDLQAIILGGEALHVKHIRPWWGRTHIVNSYGPAECTPTSLIGCNADSLEDATRIGKGAGQVTWVVDPENHNRLLPPGCIGELVVEGPLVGPGYLDDVEKTKDSFIESPEWLRRGTKGYVGRQGRLYKTGDLVQYNEDGSLNFVRRKDDQVKIRGQRVELGEVEHRIQACVAENPSWKQVVAEVIMPQGENSTPRLAAFIHIEDGEMNGTFDSSNHEAEIISISTDIEEKIAEQLPHYMIPSVFFALTELPMTASGKTNRRRLREIGASFSAQILAKIGVEKSQGRRRQPTSSEELVMQSIWSEVLALERETIYLDDNFFQLGGDSIAAMKVVSEAGKVGVQLSVADIFHHPRLWQVAKQGLQLHNTILEEVSPFSLLGDKFDTESLMRDVSLQCSLEVHERGNPQLVEDAYPCTALQEGLLSLSSKREGDYFLQGTLELAPNIDIQRFRTAWEVVFRTMAILRTRIIQSDGVGLLQVVLNHPIHWIRATGLQEYLKSDRENPMEVGRPLSRYALVTDEVGLNTWFVWTVSHALYDGWSLPMVLDGVRRVYLGETIECGTQFKHFIKYIRDEDDDKVANYWQSCLAGSDECSPFPTLLRSMQQPTTDVVVEHRLPKLLEKKNSLDITQSTLIRAAWALIAGRMTNAQQAIYGVTVSGRNAPVTGIHEMAAPTIATVPFRVNWARDMIVSEYLQHVQKQATDMIPFEQTGLQRIAKISADCRHACQFQTLLVIQSQESNSVSAKKDFFGNWEENSQDQWFNSYALMLELKPGDHGMVAKSSFDSTIIQPWIVRKLLRQLEYVMYQLHTAMPEQKLENVNMVTDYDLQQIWEWNCAMPKAAERCIHEMIRERAQARPGAPAVCAWDGELSYSELEKLATTLAEHLSQLGIRPGSIVPLCFEKSMWTVVAVLGVLKAGGAFVLLDVSLPELRLRSIVQQVQGSVLLSSFSNQSLSSRLGADLHILTINQSYFESRPITEQDNPFTPSAVPSSLLYVVFTSGSTGIPKGVRILHTNFASALHYQIERFQITENSRIYDFSSYAFDTSINNMFRALTSGGCLCVPSDYDRRNGIAESIKTLRANFAELTPTIAQFLVPEDLVELQSIVFGGEAVRTQDTERWWNTTSIFNAYGPAECTPVTVIQANAPSVEESAWIGKGAGVVTWVVDPKDHEILLPLGCVGELLIEGPLVGPGYLNDPEKTQMSFISDPSWLLRGASGPESGRRGRIYKTGDLVRYNKDGSLTYMGRKDAQVKIRGQRVELGEVEHRVHQCMPTAIQVVVEVIIPQGENSTPALAAFVQVHDQIDAAATNGVGLEGTAIKVLPITNNVEEDLAEYLPSYMVPTVFFAMQDLPITATGKMNRKRLREIGGSFSLHELVRMRSASSKEGPKRQPRSELEKHIQQVWSNVLNIEPAMIGIDDSFFQLGGDSITAMQVSSALRSLSISIRVVDILREKTISKLVGKSVVAGAPVRQQITDTQPQLSPMQRLYLQLQPDPTKSFDQRFLLHLNKRISPKDLSEALQKLVRRHSILRARFSKTQEGGWEQHISNDISGSFCLRLQDSTESESGMAQIISHCRESLDIEKGPLTAAVLFNEEQQKLFLAINHLVIDLVSWRVLFQELEELLTTNTMTSPPPMGFEIWSSMQAQYAAAKLNQETSTLSKVQVPNLTYWGMQDVPNSRRNTVMKDFVIDERVSASLLGSSNNAFDTRPVELLMSSLMYAFGAVFKDHETPPVYCEGHGREPWDDGIDISTVIGWFTTMFPIQIPSENSKCILDVIRSTKDCVRSLPQNGWSHFTSRFADETKAKQFSSGFPVEILFNYTGLYQQLERQDALFKEAPLPEGSDPPSSREVTRFALFDVNVRVERGRIVASVTYPEAIHHKERIASWINEFEATLIRVANELPSRPHEWTLSDFPLAFKSYEDLHEFQECCSSRFKIQPTDIEAIYPCSPIQEGILVAQSKDARNYRPLSRLQIQVRKAGAQLDLDKLQQAWRAVVRRHAILRAVLVDTFPGSSRTMQVILKDPEPGFTRAAAKEVVNPTENDYRPTYRKYGLHHHLTAYTVDERTAFLHFEVDHAIIDGYSRSLLWNDLRAAYQLDDLYVAPSNYGDFIAYLEEQPREAGPNFWKRHLADVEPCLIQIPTRDKSYISHSMVAVQVPSIETEKIRSFCSRWEVTTATIIQVAWALVLSKYTGTKTPCFGNLCSGRDVPIDGVDKIFGPLIAMVPCRVSLDGSRPVLETLKDVHKEYLDCLPYQHVGLADIHRILGLGAGALFNSGVSFQKSGEIDEQEENPGDGLLINSLEGHDPTEYDISISAAESKTGISIRLNVRPGIITLEDTAQIANCYSTAISEIISKPELPFSDLSIIGDSDLRRIWEWNKTVPAMVERCTHFMIQEWAHSQPNAPAVCAWDGQLSYQELDQFAAKLADQLMDLGVKRGVFVPVCFEKSAWTMVAILGVLKAGGAFVLLDANLPEQRLQTIVHQVGASVVVSSASNAALSSRLAKRVVIISSQFFVKMLEEPDEQNLPGPDPSSPMYAVFTSGSTGTPKGVVITHENAATGLTYQIPLFGFTSKSRVFDFASYGFDISISNAFATLTAGGCLCVPSEEDRRSNLNKSITSLQANAILITPSAAQVLSPEDVPNLQTIVFGGETLRARDIERWWDKVRLMHAYGPAECTQTSTINNSATTPEEVTSIGIGAGTVTWIVDSDNHECLLPVGCVGELLIEGPLVGPGYLNDDEKTRSAFIQDPAWLLRGLPNALGTSGQAGRQGRLYKTGDLVRYCDDGRLMFVGRKDAQVKIRGQRVELGEIEHFIQDCVPEATLVAAEVVMLQRQSETQALLAAFLQYDHGSPGDDATEATTAKVISMAPKVEHQLSEQLPSYMVPTVFFAMSTLPMTATGKIDRKRLREIGSSFSLHKILEIRAATQATKRHPESASEVKLQNIWSLILNIDPSLIGLDDNFFQLGGDSMAAMKIVREARKVGLEISVADVFSRPRLAQLSAGLHLLENVSHDTKSKVPPFSLLGRNIDYTALQQEIATQCLVDPSIIEDAYPCTPLQEGLLSLSLRRTGDYVMQNVLKLSSSISINDFRKAWENVFRNTEILRTRIVQLDNLDPFQAVLNEGVRWSEAVGLEEYLQSDRQEGMNVGEPLVRHALIRDSDSSSDYSWFVWTIHHSIYDGWSMPLIMNAVQQEYNGKENMLNKSAQFKEFIKFTKEKDESEIVDYWRSVFTGYDSITFPALPSAIEQPVADCLLRHQVAKPRGKSLNITSSTTIRTALAIVISRLTKLEDVVFGATVSGRSAPVVDIEEIVGPTIATVPVRVNLTNSDTMMVSDLLESVQQQATQMIPFEQSGLRQITRICPEARQACLFQTLLVIQPEAQESESAEGILGEWKETTQGKWFNTYGLVIETELGAEQITFKAMFDPRVINAWIVEKILHQLDFVMQQLDNYPGMGVGDVQTLTPHDLEEIWQWNSTVPPPIERCVHELIEELAQTQPNKPAICAWDGGLTYHELDELSTKLATRLVILGVKPGVLVPLCFEKSMWTTVAMLGVTKAGGGFVLLEPSLPEQRLQDIVHQVNASLVIASTSTQSLSLRLGATVAVLTLGSAFFTDLACNPASCNQLPLAKCDPASIMYVVFTSGSTGKPKGVMIRHRNLASALHSQPHLLGLNSDSRLFDFSSYNFDASIMNAFETLAAGGCLCIGNDQERKDNLQASIAALRANVVLLTPSVSQLLSPEQLPGLKSIIFGGEALRVRDLQQWWGKVEIFHAYGPSECTPASTINSRALSPECAIRIGKGAGMATWIVDPNDHDRLLSPGCIGELLVEGPLVGPGYLNDPVKTAAAFIENPPWLIQGTMGHSGRRGRLYKTGDLVRYNDDGSLTFIGRKDTQVKIRGQRVELGEVEHGVQECIMEAKQVVAEVVIPSGENASPLLAVFLRMKDTRQSTSHPEIFTITPHMEDELVKCLPTYMIPTVFFTMPELPMTATGKMDRRRLREIGASFSVQQLAEMRTTRSSKRQPTSPTELQLRQIWSQVLKIEPEAIGLDDSFFKLGGDSITSMRLVGEARKMGISLTVADIFRYSTLEQLANANAGNARESQAIASFNEIDLIDVGLKKHLLDEIDELEIGIQSSTVTDILPLTHFQEEYIVAGIEFPLQFCNYFYLDIGRRLDISRFRESCALTLERFPILRARFLGLHGKFWQVISESNVPVIIQEVHEDLDSALHRFCVDDLHQFSPTGQPVAFVCLWHEIHGARFILRLSHAQYDGISLPIIFRSILNSYHDESFTQPPVDFSGYLKYACQRQHQSIAYWRELLIGSSMTNIRQRLAPKGIQNHVGEVRPVSVKANIPFVALPDNITTASLISLAWAVVLSRVTRKSDIVFGRLVAGRNSALEAIEEVVGPCVNIVPARFILSPSQTPAEILLAVQEQFFAIGEADSLDFGCLREQCTDWRSNEFESVVQHQNIEEHPEFQIADTTSQIQAFENPHYIQPSFYMVSRLQSDQLEIIISTNSHIMATETARILLDGLCSTVERLVSRLHVPLGIIMDGIDIEL